MSIPLVLSSAMDTVLLFGPWPGLYEHLYCFTSN